MNSKSVKPYFYILLLFSAIFWGASFVFTKYLLHDFSPVSIIYIRTTVSGIFLLIFSILFLKSYLKIRKKDIKVILAFSFFEPFLYFIFETYSLQYTTSSIVSVIIATIPLFTALVSRYYFKENFSKTNMWGIFISMLGIALMLLPDFLENPAGITGAILAFCAVFAAVGYGYFIKKLPDTYHPVIVITYQNLTGSILFLPLFLIMGLRNGFPANEAFLDIQNIVYLLILAIFCSSLAFIFMVKGIQVVGLGKSTVFNNLIPVFTAVISFIWLKESFPVYKILGMVVVITGIFMAQRKS